MATVSASPFLNLPNMRAVMEALEARMERRHFDAVDGNARALVLEIMQDVDSDGDYAGLPVADRNDVVLRAAWDIIGDLADKRLAAVGDKGPDGLELSAAAVETAAVGPAAPRRALPTISETDRSAAPPAAAEPFAPYPDEPTPAPTPAGDEVAADSFTRAEQDRAAADFADKIVRQPWAPQARPADTTIDISVDGFDRDFDLYPDRFRFQYYCGANVANVTSVRATTLLLPVTGGDTRMNVGAPYVLVAFDEFSGNSDDGASDGLRRSFCKFIIDKVTGFPGARQFAHMIPGGGGVVAFSPPMQSLSRLTVSFTLPDGALLSEAQDTHRVRSVNMSTDGVNWVLRTLLPFAAEFEAGDIVQIRGVATASARVNDYLNRAQGHVVIAGAAVAEFDRPAASIVIAQPTKIDPVTRLIVVDEDAQLALDALPDDGAIAPAARLVNTSLQVSLSLVAVCAPSTRHEAVV